MYYLVFISTMHFIKTSDITFNPILKNLGHIYDTKFNHKHKTPTQSGFLGFVCGDGGSRTRVRSASFEASTYLVDLCVFDDKITAQQVFIT